MIRLQKLGKLLKYAYHNKVGIVLFEDLDKIKRDNKTKTRNKNIKEVKQLPEEEIIRACHNNMMEVCV